MNYYDKIMGNKVYGKIKERSKERNTVITYFEVGRL